MRLAVLALSIGALDQFTKWLALYFLPVPYVSEIHVLPGFLRLVQWHNTGAAWSMFSNNNLSLAVVSIIALIVLILARRRFGSETTLGSISLGLIYGGIVGNVIDRLMPSRQHVIDFLYFHLFTRSGREMGFPAFNVADSAICVGVGLLFILTWRSEQKAGSAGETSS